MNRLLLSPTDVLFFRDGRPMAGSLSGHGAAWPLPTVTNAALHAALWRAGKQFDNVHPHCRKHAGLYDGENRDRKFGSLVTVGPFPVTKSNEWLFPRPLDAGLDRNETETTLPTFRPLTTGFDTKDSSLPPFVKYAVANESEASKKPLSPWWPITAWQAYLSDTAAAPQGVKDDAFCDAESSIGIGIDSETDAQDGSRFYSAHYLRMKPGHHIGLLAKAPDKNHRGKDGSADLLDTLFPNSGAETPVIVGGQQRLCTVLRDHVSSIPLPQGMATGFKTISVEGQTKWCVKWVLLTPAVYPDIEAGQSTRGTIRRAHRGGSLPTWICPETGRVLLETMDDNKRRQRRHLNAEGKGYESRPDIAARLVAAIVGKPVPVTGYALPHETTGDSGKPKPTHLAVPAGSVYYFEADSENDAEKLAEALNWHGRNDFSTVRNRRSTLFGEKGFGIGVCGTWDDEPSSTASNKPS